MIVYGFYSGDDRHYFRKKSEALKEARKMYIFLNKEQDIIVERNVVAPITSDLVFDLIETQGGSWCIDTTHVKTFERVQS